MLLRQEVREPALYNSALDAIGAGNTTPQRIAEHSGVNPNSVAKYLKSLVALGIVERRPVRRKREDIQEGYLPRTV